ncbi:MAG TPA: hypothetical protein VFA20_28805, partial [Myxococcaceae bacterium]|nr:hypothetical protein [Myxococcaceae bacterium]
MRLPVLLVALLTACAGAPPRPPHREPPGDAEQAATLKALRPPKHPARPVVAVVGANEGSETTDYLIPYAVLQQSGVAEVVALGTRPGPITFWPALTVEPQATTAEFDARHPDGADYVFVPA